MKVPGCVLEELGEAYSPEWAQDNKYYPVADWEKIKEEVKDENQKDEN